MATPSRQPFDRPRSGLEARRRAFWRAAGAVVLGCALLIAFAPGDEQEPAAQSQSSLPAPPPPASPQDLAADEVPPEAQRAAEDFADGYVRFSYGLVEPREIEAATPALVDELERAAPRVPAAQQEVAAQARAAGVDSAVLSATRIEATATVEAGESSYELAFELRRTGQRWVVTDVSAPA